jgi:hypothetical protein
VVRILAAAVLASALATPLHRAAAAEADPAAEAKPRESFAIVPGPFYNPHRPRPQRHAFDDVPPRQRRLRVAAVAGAGERPLCREAAIERGVVASERVRERGFSALPRRGSLACGGDDRLHQPVQQYYGIGGDASYSDPLFDYRLEQLVAFAQVYRQVGWKGSAPRRTIPRTSRSSTASSASSGSEPCSSLAYGKSGLLYYFAVGQNF